MGKNKKVLEWFQHSAGSRFWVPGQGTQDQYMTTGNDESQGPTSMSESGSSEVASSVAIHQTSHSTRIEHDPGPVTVDAEVVVTSHYENEEEMVFDMYDADQDIVMVVDVSNGVETPNSASAEWGANSIRSKASDTVVVNQEQQFDDMLRGAGYWTRPIHPPFLSNRQNDYPQSSFWHLTITRALSEPPGLCGNVCTAELNFMALEPGSQSMPMLQDYGDAWEIEDNELAIQRSRKLG